MKVYIAGPMRGLPDWNFPAFDRAERAWRAAGHVPFSPASVAVALGYGLRPRLVYDGEPADTARAQPHTVEGRCHLQHVILSDIASLFAADAIALLPGWQHSTGATVELALAQFLGLDVYDAETMQRLTPPRQPWGALLTATSGAALPAEQGIIEVVNTPPSANSSDSPDDWGDVWRGLADRYA